MNSVNIVGRLVRDPEQRQVGDTTKSEVTIAVDRRYKKEGQKTADFIRVEAWGKAAESLCKYLTKGRPVAITGRLEQQEWESDGQKKSRTVVVVENWSFVPSDKGAGPSEPEEEMPF